MFSRGIAIFIGVASMWGLVGCGAMQTAKESTFVDVRDVAAGQILLTDAKVRAIMPTMGSDGRTHTCAEPSPDVASAFSSSLSQSISAAVSGLPSGVSPKVAAAVTRSAAESMAQLGERLATIQLLRDGLYRACEAHANGALTSTGYAVLLSRYDDTMVTMLGAELAAGAFGRSLAALGTETSGETGATLDVNETLKEQRDALDTLKESVDQQSKMQSLLDEVRQEQKQVKTDLAAAQAQGDAGADDAKMLEQRLKTSQSQEASLKTSLDQSNKLTELSERNMQTKLGATAKAMAKASATAAGGITPGTQNPEIARVLEDMQKNYVENINTDALDVACLTALDRSAAELTVLGEVCRERDLFARSGKSKLRVFDRVADLNQHKSDNQLREKMVEKGLDPFAVKKAAIAASIAAAQAEGAPRSAGAMSPGRVSGQRMSETVKWVQESLNMLSAASLPVNGVKGPATIAAIKKFQQANGLSVDGIAGKDTNKKLRELMIKKAGGG